MLMRVCKKLSIKDFFMKLFWFKINEFKVLFVYLDVLVCILDNLLDGVLMGVSVRFWEFVVIVVFDVIVEVVFFGWSVWVVVLEFFVLLLDVCLFKNLLGLFFCFDMFFIWSFDFVEFFCFLVVCFFVCKENYVFIKFIFMMYDR